MKKAQVSAAAVGALLMAMTACWGEPPGIGGIMPATDVKMTNVDGTKITLDEVKGKSGILVVFCCNHCPFVKAWQDRMVQLGNEYVKLNVGVIFVNSNDPSVYPEDSFDNMKKVAAGKGYTFPYVMDETLSVARAFGAKRTPEAFLFNSSGKLFYHGTIDDSAEDPAKVTKPYLRAALEKLLEGRSVPDPETKSVGCSIALRPSADD